MRFLTPSLTSTLLVLASSANFALAHNSDSELEIEYTKSVNCTRPTQNKDTVTVHYLGTLAFDGSKFDSSYDYGQPFTFTLGAGQVIKGWDKGLLGMCVGDKRKLVIPPQFGYGDMTVGPIPGGSTLVFETELMGIEGIQSYDPAKPTPTQTGTPAETTAQPAKGSPTTSSAESPYQQEGDGKCHLLGSFALLVQGALGLLAMLSLVWKRYHEVPRRPAKVWFFDASKQVFGSVLVHLANLFLSMLSSGTFDVKTAPGVKGRSNDAGKSGPNPCSFYLLNLAIDTTIGIPILVLLLRVLHALFLKTSLANPPQSIRSGNYGNPPRLSWWFKQSIIYFMGLFGMKFCVFLMFQLLPWIAWVGDWALRWTEGNQKVQIAFVMFVFPVIMNAIQYYIIDSFIKENSGSSDDDRGEHRPLAQDDDDSDLEDDERRRRRDRSFAVGDDDDDDDQISSHHLKEANPTTVPVYDEEERGGSSDGNAVGHNRPHRTKA